MKKITQGLAAFALIAGTTAVIAGCSSKNVKSDAANDSAPTTQAAALTDWDANAAKTAAVAPVDTTTSGATSDPVDLGGATPGRSR